MLFDLRGRGRQRTVRVIYLSLALLMGVGLVGFGVGGGLGGGGIVDALKSNGSGGAPTSFTDRVKADQRRTGLAPNDPAAWATLTRDQFLVAGQGDNYDSQQGQFTTKGKDQLALVKTSWDRYLSLTPTKPNPDLANQMVQVLGPGGLNQPAAAVQALQIVIGARPPSASLFANLAALSYQAGNARQGDLATAKALSLTPATQRSALQAQLAQLKKTGTGTGGSAGTTTVTPGSASGAATVTPTTAAPTTPKPAKH